MDTEAKFKAAVNVIRNLPPKGSMQPSHHVMLKFYGLFKQATEGANKSSKPPFWDLVRKAKWDAWSKLGNMDQETAMQLYVEEFKKIVEGITASNVGNIDKAEIDSFYASVPIKDLELLVGPVITNSRSNSPSAELNNAFIGEITDILEERGKLPSEVAASLSNNDVRYRKEINGPVEFPRTNGSIRSDEDDDEDFLDTIENSDHGSVKHRLSIDEKIQRTNSPYAYMNGHAIQVSDYPNYNRGRLFSDDPETSLQLSKVIIHLQKDLEKVVKSVNVIEQRLGQLGKIAEQNTILPHFVTSPLLSFIILFSWPVLLQLLIIWLRRKK